MTLTLNPSSNGKLRKSLASQLDRFDAILDGLADAIPQVVAETVRTVADQTVREVVQSVLTEVLTDPAILKTLQAAAAPVSGELGAAEKTKPEQPTLTARLAATWQSVRVLLGRARAVVAAQVGRTVNAVRLLGRRIAILCAPLAILRRMAVPILIALGVGVAMAAAAWYCGPIASAALSFLGGVGSSLAVQGGLLLRRLLSLDKIEAA